MSYETEHYADKWVRRYKEHQAATLQGQSVDSLLGLGRVVPTTAVQSETGGFMSLDKRSTGLSNVDPVIEAVVHLHKALGLTQAGFARRLNISPRTFTDWISQRRRPSGPSLALLMIAIQHPEYIANMDKPI